MTSNQVFIYFICYRILIFITIWSFLIIGYNLFLKGVKTKSNKSETKKDEKIDIVTEEVKISLRNASPGSLVMALGVFAFIGVLIFSPPSYDHVINYKSNEDNGIDNSTRTEESEYIRSFDTSALQAIISDYRAGRYDDDLRIVIDELIQLLK